MNIPEQSNLLCRKCGQKTGCGFSPAAIWHYATCVKCHNKEAVTEHLKPAAA
jgi:predicted nucleic-acid-binding Zn-ribbon protein